MGKRNCQNPYAASSFPRYEQCHEVKRSSSTCIPGIYGRQLVVHCMKLPVPRPCAHGSSAYCSKSSVPGASRPSSAWSTMPGYDAAFCLVVLSTSLIEEQGTAATSLSIAEQIRHSIAMFHVCKDGYLLPTLGTRGSSVTCAGCQRWRQRQVAPLGLTVTLVCLGGNPCCKFKVTDAIVTASASAAAVVCGASNS